MTTNFNPDQVETLDQIQHIQTFHFLCFLFESYKLQRVNTLIHSFPPFFSSLIPLAKEKNEEGINHDHGNQNLDGSRVLLLYIMEDPPPCT